MNWFILYHTRLLDIILTYHVKIPENHRFSDRKGIAMNMLMLGSEDPKVVPISSQFEKEHQELRQIQEMHGKMPLFIALRSFSLKVMALWTSATSTSVIFDEYGHCGPGIPLGLPQVRTESEMIELIRTSSSSSFSMDCCVKLYTMMNRTWMQFQLIIFPLSMYKSFQLGRTLRASRTSQDQESWRSKSGPTDGVLLHCTMMNFFMRTLKIS